MPELVLDWFRSPPKSAGPMARWWWPGMDVEKDLLLQQVGEMDESGLAGAEIQVFGIGLPRKMEKTDPERFARVHRFGQPYYYEMVKAVLDEAAARGMTIDLTVCSSWPAGGTHVSEADSLKTAWPATKAIKGGTTYRGPLPKLRSSLLPIIAKISGTGMFLHEADPADMKPVAVVAAKVFGKPGKFTKLPPKAVTWLDVASAVDLTDKVAADRTLEWDAPEGTWQLVAFYEGPTGESPKNDTREGGSAKSYVVDHFSSGPIAKHLEHHIGRGLDHWSEHVGDTLRAIFTDSFELSAEMVWTERFLEEFEARRGYDLTPYLPACFVPARDSQFLRMLTRGIVKREMAPNFDFAADASGPSDAGQRLRYDFELTMGELFTELFVRTMGEWCAERGLLSRIQAYGVRADTLRAYGVSHIPETEQLYSGGARDFFRFAGSAALLYEQPVVTAESIVFNSRDYLTTPLKWKVAADRLFVSGVNQMVYHSQPYRRPEDGYPGTHPFASPHNPRMPGMTMTFSADFTPVNTFWNFMPAMNAYITRCQAVLQRGVPGCDVGMFYPLFSYPNGQVVEEEMAGGYLDEMDTPLAKAALFGRAAKDLGAEELWIRQFIQTADHLQSLGYSYAHVNTDSLLHARVEDGRLVMGNARLKALIVPDVEQVSVEVAEKIKEVADSGIPVAFLRRAPTKQPGFLSYKENDLKVRDLCEGVAEQLNSFVRTPAQLAVYLSRAGVAPGVSFDSAQPAVHYMHRRADDGDYYFVRSAQREPLEVWITLPHRGCVPYLMDPWTGEVTEAALYTTTEAGVRVGLRFTSFGSTIVLLRPGSPSRHVTEADLPVVRAGPSLLADASQAGSYRLMFGNGQSGALRVESDAPSPVTLGPWRLDSEIRAYDGSITPVAIRLDTLTDWREIEKVRYCSSSGTYSTTFTLDESYLANGLVVKLDLGLVYDVAAVEINGTRLPPMLVFPYAVEVTDYVQEGTNDIRVTVTPTLRNRLVRYAKDGIKACKPFKGKELSPSGLIGPVTLTPAWRFELSP